MRRIDEEHLREDLQQRLDEALDELKKLRTKETRLRRFVAGIRDVLGTLNHEGPQGKLPLEEPKNKAVTVRTEVPIQDMSMKDGAYAILQQVGPLTTRELLENLKTAGKRIGGQVPRDTLAATLRGYPHVFRRTSDGTKWEIVPAEQESDSAES